MTGFWRLEDLPAWVAYVYAVFLGLFGGSFLNVVIYRVPRGLSVVRPASHCPGCGAPVKFYDNVPVVSYLVLRGRARCCGVAISPRYVLIEIVGGVLGWAVLENVFSWLPPDAGLLHGIAVFAADLTFALSLVAVAFIDLEHMYVPDAISIGGAIFGIATFSLRPRLELTDALIGSLVGFMVVWLPFGVLYRWIRGRTGMGLGDAKLLMLAGAWFGWPGAVFSLLAGAVQGTLAALAILLFRGRIEEPAAVQAEKLEMQEALAELSPEERAIAEAELADDPLYESSSSELGQARIAFGPFLVLAMLEYLLIGREALSGYVRWLGLTL